VTAAKNTLKETGSESTEAPARTTRVCQTCARFLPIGLVASYAILHAVLWYNLDHRPMTNDEYYHRPAAFQAYEALRSPDLSISQRFEQVLLTGDSYPPMTYLAGIPFCALLGKTIFSLRLVSCFAMGIAMLCVFGMLRRMTCPRWSSCLGAFVFAAMPFTINQSRLYMNEGLLMAVVALFYYVILLDPDLKNRAWAVVGGIVLGVGVLTKWTYPFFVTLPLCYIYARIWWPKANWGVRKESEETVWKSRWNSLLLGVVGVLVALPYYLHSEPWEKLGVMSNNRARGAWHTLDVNGIFLNVSQLVERLWKPYGLGPIIVILVLLGLMVLVLDRSKRSNIILIGILSSFVLVSVLMRSIARYSTPYFPLLAVAIGFGVAKSPVRRLRGIFAGCACLIILLNLTASWDVAVLPRGAYKWAKNIAPPRLYPPTKPEAGTWKLAEIADAILRDLGDRKKAIIFMPFYYRDFDPQKLHIYGTDRGIDLHVCAWSHEALLYGFFNGHYLITKSGDPGGKSMLAVYHRFLAALPASFYEAHFEKLAEFPLPDKSEATLYRSKRAPLPPKVQLEAFSLAMNNDETLRQDPFLLLQLATKLWFAGQRDLLRTLSSEISDAVETTLKREDTSAVTRAYLLRNYATWLLRVDAKKALETWERLEAEPYQTSGLKAPLYPEIVNAALRADDLEKAWRFCMAWLGTDPGNLDALRFQAAVATKREKDPSPALKSFEERVSKPLKTDDPAELVTAGKLLVKMYWQMGRSDDAQRVVETLTRNFPDRKDLRWLTVSTGFAVAHGYDWLRDPVKILGCTIVSKDRTWLKANVSEYAYIFPAGHAAPFAADGSFAIQFDMRIVPKRPMRSGQLRIYLNTHSGLGPKGSDWGEFDRIDTAADVSGNVKRYVLPLRSKVENAQQIYEYRIDPLWGKHSYRLEIGNILLLKLQPQARN